MSLVTQIALARNRLLYVKKETTFGVAVTPGSTDKVMPLDDLNIQPLQPSFINSREVTGSRDLLTRFVGKTPAGQFGFSVYGKPSGVAGTAPDGAALFEAVMGAPPSITPSGLTCLTGSTASALKVTAGQLSSSNIGDLLFVDGQVVMITSYTGGTPDTIGITPSLPGAPTIGDAIGRSVNYKPSTFLPSLTLLSSDTHTSLLSSGAVMESLSFKLTGIDESIITFGGSLAAQVATGTDAVGAGGVADGSVTTFPVADCSKFEVGSLFNCEAETGIKVTAVSTPTGAGNLTVVRGSGAAAHAAAVATTPWIPTGTSTGAPVHGKLGTLNLGGVAVKYTSLQIDLKNGNKMIDTEAGSSVATDYVEGPRAVTGSIKIFFRKDDLVHFRQAQKQTDLTLVAQAGNAAGSIVAVVLQKMELDLPAIAGNAERELDFKFTAFGVSGNDVMTLGFL